MRRIGQYTVDAEIGEGGMGTVYRALDPRFGRMVAVKVLHPQYQRDPAFIDRFKKEAVLQAKLSHPNIVSVIDFIADDSTLAMVLEYVNGPSLADLVREAGGPIQEGRALRLMIQVLSALHFAHEHQVVHRDIKPANILVVRFGNEEVAKVLDFGIAKIAGDEKGRTQIGAKMGTLGYMSPEQIRSPRDTDRRADVYSAGVVLYELLTGRVPFDADTEYEMMQRIVKETPALSGLPARVARILERALDKDPDRRFQTASLMRDALVGLMTGQVEAALPARAAPVLSRPRATGASPDLFARIPAASNRVPAAIGVAIIVIAAGAGGVWWLSQAIARGDFGFATGVDSVVAGIETPVDTPVVTPPATPLALPTPVPPDPTPNPTPTPTAFPGNGTLRVGQLPWPLVSVSIDSRPVRGAVPFTPGTYTAVFSADRSAFIPFPSIPQSVTLSGGQTIDLATRVPTGSLSVTGKPDWVTLSFGNLSVSEGTVLQLPRVAAGKYPFKIVANRAGYPVHSEDVDIAARVETVLSYRYIVDPPHWQVTVSRVTK